VAPWCGRCVSCDASLSLWQALVSVSLSFGSWSGYLFSFLEHLAWDAGSRVSFGKGCKGRATDCIH
jgi:hypothetical protein